MPLNENAVNTMKANKGRDTKPELLLRQALRANGMSGYRLHWKIPRRPDICYLGRRLAIFVNGCFWHRCPRCDLPIPKNNRDFWVEKFARNQERDARVCRELEEQGWDPHIIRGCNIKWVLDSVMKVVRCHLFPRTSVGPVYLSDGVLQCDSSLDNIFSGGSGAGYPAVMIDAWSGVLIVTGEGYSSVVVG